MADTETLLRRLKDIYPEPRLLLERAQLAAFESDALTAFRVPPLAVVLAESSDEVVRTVRLCHELGVPFVPREAAPASRGAPSPWRGGSSSR